MIHITGFKTQYMTLLMLLKTLCKLYEQIIQHRIAPLRVSRLETLCYATFLRGSLGSLTASAPCAHIARHDRTVKHPAPKKLRSVRLIVCFMTVFRAASPERFIGARIQCPPERYAVSE